MPLGWKNVFFLIGKMSLISVRRPKQANFFFFVQKLAGHVVEPTTSYFLSKMVYFSVIMFFVFNLAIYKSAGVGGL